MKEEMMKFSDAVHRERVGVGRPWFSLLSFSLLLLLPSLLQATRVRPMNLEEMTRRAKRIFSGRCIGVEAIRDPATGLEVTRLTFRVDRMAKGKVDKTVTVQLLGGQAAGPAKRKGIPGMPRFRKGEEVVLFLYGESGMGLSSPVGLGQGKFLIHKDKRGGKVALNGFGNRTLFRKLSGKAAGRMGKMPERWKGREGIPPDVLLDLVTAIK